MAHNPLLGSRISLISKKNIRYEGTLYSINEFDATVALQTVRSYGTEGRETADGTVLVAPQDAVHPYLLFRGCDIKDLHVHDNAHDTPDPAVASSAAPPEARVSKRENEGAGATSASASVADGSEDGTASKADTDGGSTDMNRHQRLSGPKSGAPRRTRKQAQMVGSGASLLNRKARGAVEGASYTPQVDFDFQSNLAGFDKVTLSDNSESEDVSADADDEVDVVGVGTSVYQKEDFFDSISCDVLDKQNGIDNRFRGSAERSLNTETFGAVSLGNSRRGGRRYNKRGGSRGGRVVRGAGRGGNRDCAYRAGNGTEQPRENNRWKRGSSDRPEGRSVPRGRRIYGDGGLGASAAQTTWAGGDRQVGT